MALNEINPSKINTRPFFQPSGRSKLRLAKCHRRDESAKQGHSLPAAGPLLTGKRQTTRVSCFTYWPLPCCDSPKVYPVLHPLHPLPISSLLFGLMLDIDLSIFDSALKLFLVQRSPLSRELLVFGRIHSSPTAANYARPRFHIVVAAGPLKTFLRDAGSLALLCDFLY